MAIRDALKLLKFNKLYNKTWSPVWELVKAPPEDGADVVVHLCFVGTLIYAIRYQVALKVGMDDGFAKTLAVMAISKTGYDREMEDIIYAVFSVEANPASAAYVSALYDCVNRVITDARQPGSSGGESLDAMLRALKSHYESLGTGETDSERADSEMPLTATDQV